MVKSETEVAILTEACKIHDSIFKRTFETVETGMTTQEIINLFQRITIESDAQFGWVIVCIGDFDPRQAAGSSQPDRRLNKSDLLWVDLGLVMHGYHTDYCRGMVPGGASSEQLENKFEKTGLTPVASELVDAPYIVEFPLVLECKVLHTVEIGLHTEFIGEILDIKADETVLREDGNPDMEKVKPIAYEPVNRRYFRIGSYLAKAHSIGREI